MTLSFFFFFFLPFCRVLTLVGRWISSRKLIEKKMAIYEQQRNTRKCTSIQVAVVLYKHPFQTIAFCWCYNEIIPTEERGLFFISAYNILPPPSRRSSQVSKTDHQTDHISSLYFEWNSFSFSPHRRERVKLGRLKYKGKTGRQWTGRPVKSNQFWIELINVLLMTHMQNKQTSF